MTPPRAVIDAAEWELLHALRDGRMEINAANRREVAAEIANAVLAAFFAGEPEGEWRVIINGTIERRTPWYTVRNMRGYNHIATEFEDRDVARRVAHALNWRGE